MRVLVPDAIVQAFLSAGSCSSARFVESQGVADREQILFCSHQGSLHRLQAYLLDAGLALDKGLLTSLELNLVVQAAEHLNLVVA